LNVTLVVACACSGTIERTRTSAKAQTRRAENSLAWDRNTSEKPAFSGYKAREFQRNEHEFQIYILDIELELGVLFMRFPETYGRLAFAESAI
jgi:hypothetical protein